jgi:serine/threonine-protein kinase
MSGDHQRLRAEAENLARLTHHNIVRVFDVAEHDGRTVISMELIEGGSLHDHGDRFRNDPRALAALMVAIARGVHYAHQRGILHRDLKPSNVLLGGEPQDPSHPYVSDFGLATLIATDELRREAISASLVTRRWRTERSSGPRATCRRSRRVGNGRRR